ncbi:MAG: PTS sugar transporter subunit IIA [Treponema sp.]|nr:PTS sugar transporter subunit IIA [Treponema sp.]
MNLKNILREDSIALHLKGGTKEEIIDELLVAAAKSGRLKDVPAARRSILERERRMSTGMKHGIAIPHGKTDAVDSLIACIGVSDKGVDFDALDRELCRIFILTLSPSDKTGPHLQFLAEVSLLFRSEEKRQAILAAKDAVSVLKVFTEQE